MQSVETAVFGLYFEGSAACAALGKAGGMQVPSDSKGMYCEGLQKALDIFYAAALETHIQMLRGAALPDSVQNLRLYGESEVLLAEYVWDATTAQPLPEYGAYAVLPYGQNALDTMASLGYSDVAFCSSFEEAYLLYQKALFAFRLLQVQAHPSLDDTPEKGFIALAGGQGSRISGYKSLAVCGTDLNSELYLTLRHPSEHFYLSSVSDGEEVEIHVCPIPQGEPKPSSPAPKAGEVTMYVSPVDSE